MAGIDVSVSKELLPELLGSRDGLARLVEAVLNQILEAQDIGQDCNLAIGVHGRITLVHVGVDVFWLDVLGPHTTKGRAQASGEVSELFCVRRRG